MNRLGYGPVQCMPTIGWGQPSLSIPSISIEISFNFFFLSHIPQLDNQQTLSCITLITMKTSQNLNYSSMQLFVVLIEQPRFG